MMKDTITLNRDEQQRVRVMSQVLEGTVSIAEAAVLVNRSVRHTRRMVTAFRAEGITTVVHGNRCRVPAHTLDEETRTLIVDRLRTEYRDLNDCHVAEVLALRDGVVVSRSTVRRLRIAAGMARPKTRRAPQHRSRRERRPQAGMLVQIDGSHHRWFGPDHPPCVLLAAVDDATGLVVAAHFWAGEDAAGYLLLLQQLAQTHGLPHAVYHDGHGIFVRSPKETASIAEDVARRTLPTQVGRAFVELGIASIRATSPQAKGRIERLFGTLQDRLVHEFALDGICTLTKANAVLPAFLARYNARFAVPAADPHPAWRPLDPEHHLEQICAFAYARTVAADNTVSVNGQTIQLDPAPDRPSFARCRVQVRQHLDGTFSVWWNERRLPVRAAPPSPTQLRAAKGCRVDPYAQRHDPAEPVSVTVEPEPVDAVAILSTTPWKPAATHPWRKPFNPERTFSQNS